VKHQAMKAYKGETA